MQNLDYVYSHWDILQARIWEHVAMSVLSVGLATVLGTGLSLFVLRYRAWRLPVLTLVGLIQTIPGLALLVVAISLLDRIGAAPAIATLVLFALLPIVQNAIIGIESVDPSLTRVARAMGMTLWQRFRYIQFPLALPNILAGVRVAAVQTVGLTTLAAFIGAGGLSQLINRGLSLSDTNLILLGAIPAALLALGIHLLVHGVELSIDRRVSRKWRRTFACLVLVSLIAIAVYSLWQGAAGLFHGTAQPQVVVGSKNFTEQLIVAEIVARSIEERTDLTVERRFGLGGTAVLHEALVQGSVDVAVEYTGTAFASILKQPFPADRAQSIARLRVEYERRYGLTWLAPLGFDNAYRLAVRKDDPRLQAIQTITQLVAQAPSLAAAFDFEFAEREDGYAGLQKVYGLRFGQVRDMQPDLLYNALILGHTDVISAYTTDGRLDRTRVRLLEDDKRFFPPYVAAIVVAPCLLTEHPELASALHALQGTLSDETMQRLNAEVDAGRMSVEEAAAQVISALSAGTVR